MTAYYNEIDPYAAAWLRNLIAAGLIAPGEVDERDIRDVRPDELAGFAQCHFFAGIGGWSYAARLAGWLDDRPMWTGSCPCQPFSVAGKGEGKTDERHLWPAFFELIRACRPDVVMGEQVAAAVGKHWLDGVCTDLEGVGYAVGTAVVPVCAVDAPHRRDRLWFVADAECGVSDGRPVIAKRGSKRGTAVGRPGPVALAGNSWSCTGWIIGADRKARRVPQSGIRLLAHGVPARVAKLRALGNAIVPQVAAEVIAAYSYAKAEGHSQ